MSFEYSRALMRPVTESLLDKVRSTDSTIKLNFANLQREQNKLAEVLKKRRINVTYINANPNYPEGCFIEDCAVIIGETALICRPADQSRRGEVGVIRKYLEKEIHLKVHDLMDPNALLDGGDVLFTGMYLLFLTFSFFFIPSQIYFVVSESKLLFQQIKERTSNTYFKLDFDSDVPASVLFANGTLIHRSREEMGVTNCSILDEKIGYDRDEVELREFDKLNRTISSLCLLINRIKTTRQIMSDINDEDINSYSTLTRKSKDYYK
ncbi:N(G),N(G)-dimethylarginine dimethylaminohydrolase 1 [Octopus bimaculoides]|nr:N(G),N(G)-dimethylarginine dimethylaminohydrolase 1 [Octopus bimaculoides]